jgi:hypothetical protein
VNRKYNESSLDEISQAGNPAAIFTAGKGVVHTGFAAALKAGIQGERIAGKQISSGSNPNRYRLSFNPRCNAKIA